MIRATPLLLLFVAGVAAADPRVGPASNPEAHEDWGGTPDAALSHDIGLTDEELAALLQKLSHADVSQRREGAAEIRRNAMGSESTIRKALYANQGARNDQIRAAMRLAQKSDADDILHALLLLNPSDETHREGLRAALRVVTMLFALHDLNSLVGYKIMLAFSGRHAGAFRQLVGNMMVTRGLDALPALVYGRGSKDKELHMFSVAWIREMGNPLLSEQIQGIRNPRRLAQLLEAYASVNDLSTIDVTLSMANHESVFVRRAARSALAAYGRNARWQLRRQYENTFSQPPKGDTDFEQWRQALYDFWDQERIKDALREFERGQQAATAGDFETMHQHYSRVLLDEPLFVRRGEMATSYLSWSKQLEKTGAFQRAEEMNRLALRLSDADSMTRAMAGAGMDWLAAEAALQGGAANIHVYRRIADADPTHEGAAQRVVTLLPESDERRQLFRKGIGVSLCIFLALLIAYFRLRRPRASRENFP